MADIFVSYASPDRDVAFRIVGFLEEQGITCWVAPRDVPPGVEYGQAIINAIEQSRALVLILSDQSNDSQFVRKEVERAVSKTKPVLPVRIREVTPSGSLEFFISSAQWVDAWKSPMEQHLLPLVAAIRSMGKPDAAPVRSSALPPPRRSQVPMLLGLGIIALVGVAAAMWFAGRNSAPGAPVASAPSATTPAPSAPAAAPAPPTAPVPPAATPTAPAAPAPVPAAQAPEAKPAGPKRSDIAFVTGSWCQPYQGMTIRYNVIRTGADTVITQVNHPQSPNWEVAARIKIIKGGFEFQPVDAAPDDRNIARFSIVDESTLKLTRADGEAQNGPVRVRCPPGK
jgi:TIR domain-containing protein